MADKIMHVEQNIRSVASRLDNRTISPFRPHSEALSSVLQNFIETQISKKSKKFPIRPNLSFSNFAEEDEPPCLFNKTVNHKTSDTPYLEILEDNIVDKTISIQRNSSGSFFLDERPRNSSPLPEATINLLRSFPNRRSQNDILATLDRILPKKGVEVASWSNPTYYRDTQPKYRHSFNSVAPALPPRNRDNGATAPSRNDQNETAPAFHNLYENWVPDFLKYNNETEASSHDYNYIYENDVSDISAFHANVSVSETVPDYAVYECESDTASSSNYPRTYGAIPKVKGNIPSHIYHETDRNLVLGEFCDFAQVDENYSSSVYSSSNWGYHARNSENRKVHLETEVDIHSHISNEANEYDDCEHLASHLYKKVEPETTESYDSAVVDVDYSSSLYASSSWSYHARNSENRKEDLETEVGNKSQIYKQKNEYDDSETFSPRFYKEDEPGFISIISSCPVRNVSSNYNKNIRSFPSDSFLCHLEKYKNDQCSSQRSFIPEQYENDHRLGKRSFLPVTCKDNINHFPDSHEEVRHSERYFSKKDKEHRNDVIDNIPLHYAVSNVSDSFNTSFTSSSFCSTCAEYGSPVKSGFQNLQDTRGVFSNENILPVRSSNYGFTEEEDINANLKSLSNMNNTVKSDSQMDQTELNAKISFSSFRPHPEQDGINANHIGVSNKYNTENTYSRVDQMELNEMISSSSFREYSEQDDINANLNSASSTCNIVETSLNDQMENGGIINPSFSTDNPNNQISRVQTRTLERLSLHTSGSYHTSEELNIARPSHLEDRKNHSGIQMCCEKSFTVAKWTGGIISISVSVILLCFILFLFISFCLSPSQWLSHVKSIINKIALHFNLSVSNSLQVLEIGNSSSIEVLHYNSSTEPVYGIESSYYQ